MSEKRTVLVFVLRGMIEVGCPRRGKPFYRWAEGYSEKAEGAVIFPWMTYRQCQSQARVQGCVAKFERTAKIT